MKIVRFEVVHVPVTSAQAPPSVSSTWSTGSMSCGDPDAVAAAERTGHGKQHGAVAAQPRIWTFVDVEAPSSQAGELARALAAAPEPDLGWWADFTVDDGERVVVLAGRVFRDRIGDDAARAEAVAWGRAAGPPEYQLDWGP